MAEELPAQKKLQMIKGSLLLVDDEESVLNALRRVLKGAGWRDISLASSGAQGLEILGTKAIDVVISDMRMPHMDGAEFLRQVALRWPGTERILLTGYADMASTIDAVNQGHIYGYLSKPWNNDDLLLTIQRALGKKRLADALQEKNEELAKLNETLETRVAMRTIELREALGKLNQSNVDLKKQLMDVVRAFSKLIETKSGIVKGHSRYLAENSRKIAAKFELSESETMTIVVAGLLSQIGKVSLPESLLTRPVFKLPAQDRNQYYKYAVEGGCILQDVAGMAAVATIIRHQLERYDGSGVPDGLVGSAIPLGARIIAVVRDYHLYLSGLYLKQSTTVAEAQEHLIRCRGSRYDPQVVDYFLQLIGRVKRASHQGRFDVLPIQLQPGMEIESVRTPDFSFYRDTVATPMIIEHIMELRQTHGLELEVKVRARKQILDT